MLIRVSPQWQVTIPKPFRRGFGHTRLAEARMERGALMLRPVLAETVSQGAEMFSPEGITQEVLVAALGIVERRRRQQAAAEGQPPDMAKP